MGEDDLALIAGRAAALVCEFAFDGKCRYCQHKAPEGWLPPQFLPMNFEDSQHWEGLESMVDGLQGRDWPHYTGCAVALTIGRPREGKPQHG